MARWATWLLSSAALGLCAQAAQAQSTQAQTTTSSSPSGAQLEELVVTAQKRAENLQAVPATVSAFSSERIEAQAITDSADIQNLVPGLVITKSLSSGITYVRGVGQNTGALGVENSVATYIDGVYLAQPSAGLFSLSNIERVEVLKGPQGTLFGRNATGGVLHIITKDPTGEREGNFDIGYGNYNTITSHLYFSTPITDTFGASIAAFVDNRNDGYVRNIFLNKDLYQDYNHGVQTKLRWTPTERTEVLLHANYSFSKGYAGSTTATPEGSLAEGGAGYLGRYRVALGVDTPNSVWQSLQSLKVTHDFAWGRVTNIAAFHQVGERMVLVQNGLPQRAVNISFNDTGETFTNELQIQSLPGSSLDWIVGAFYMHDKASTRFVARRDAAAFRSATNYITTDSYSAFAQVTKEVFPRTRLTLGARYTIDQRELDGTQYGPTGAIIGTSEAAAAARGFDLTSEWRDPTFRVSLDHDFTDDIMGYVSYNRGFKSGVYNPTSPVDPAANPEHIDAYEVGVKSELFDRRLRLNASAFYYDYRDIQIRTALPETTTVITYNAANSEVYGLDLDFEFAATSALRITGGFEVLDAKYKDFPNGACAVPLPGGGNGPTVVCDLSGERMVRAPKFAGNIGVSYRHDLANGGDLTFAVNDSYNSGFAFEITQKIKQEAYHWVTASAKWRSADDRYWVQLWGKNLADEYVVVYATRPSSDTYSPGAPRTYGVTLGVNF